jgi:hypothetical protein
MIFLVSLCVLGTLTFLLIGDYSPTESTSGGRSEDNQALARKEVARKEVEDRQRDS